MCAGKFSAQLCQHHRPSCAAGRRRGVQDLLCDRLATGGEQFPGVSADAGGVLQYSPDRHSLRQSVAVKSAGHIEHGQAVGFVPRLHAHLGGVIPARSHGRAAQAGKRRFRSNRPDRR